MPEVDSLSIFIWTDREREEWERGIYIQIICICIVDNCNYHNFWDFGKIKKNVLEHQKPYYIVSK